MKNNLKICMKLMRFSLSRRTNILIGVLFFMLGLALELCNCVGVMSDKDFFPIPAGAIFILCTAMFPSQMLVSVDVCTFAQVSSYKKKLQTSLPAVILMISILLAFTLIVLLRSVGIVMKRGDFSEELNIFPIALFAVFIVLYSGVVYKFFVLSVVMLYAVMTTLGAIYGYSSEAGRAILPLASTVIGPAADLLLSYVLIVIASGLQYLISLALYRFPLSKYALRCSHSKN